MAKTNSFTYSLMKVLSPSEKAYVKKYIKSSGKHLVQLFDDLNKCSSYQKDNFILVNANKSYIENLSQNKNYLNRKIIEALIRYRMKTVFEIESRNQVNEAYILIEKKFYKRAKKIIDNCLTEALHREDYATCYILVGLIFKITQNKDSFGLSQNEIDQYYKDRHFYLKQLNRIDSISELMEIHNKRNYYSPSISVNNYKKKIAELNLDKIDDLNEDFPFYAKRIFYFCKAQLSWLSGDNSKYVFNCKKNLNLYVENKKYLEYNIKIFIVDAINFLNSLIEIKDIRTFISEHKKVVDLLNNFKKNTNNSENSLSCVLFYLLPQAAYNVGKLIDKSILLTNDYEVYIKKNKNKLSTHFKAVSSIQISLSYLYAHFYKKALSNLESALEHKEYRSQYQSRLLQIIIHYLSGNDLLLDHLFQSFINYLKSVGKKEQIPNIRKLKKHTKNKTVHLLKNEDFEDFLYIHWDLFEQR